MKKLLIVTNTMGRAGAEKSLIALLRGLDGSRVAVSLLSIIGMGEMFAEVPDGAHILNRKYSAVPVLGIPGALRIAGTAAARLFYGGVRFLPYLAGNAVKQIKAGRFQPDKLLWRMLAQTAPVLDGEYDLAVAFLEGAATYYVADKVRAKKKLAFVHVNYEKAGYDREHDRGYYEKMDYICCVSEAVRTALNGVFPELTGRTRVFPNLVDVGAIRLKADEPGGFTDNFTGIRLLTVARLHPQKGIDAAVLSLSRLARMGGYDGVRWYVIGEGMERPRLKRLIKKQGLAGRFVLLGARENPYPYMKHCDVYVQPSRFEGLSLTLYEALLLGKPCVATAFDGVPDLLKAGRDALIVPFSVEDIADALRTVIDDAQVRERLAGAAKEIRFDFPNKIHVLYGIMDGLAWEEESCER